MSKKGKEEYKDRHEHVRSHACEEISKVWDVSQDADDNGLNQEIISEYGLDKEDIGVLEDSVDDTDNEKDASANRAIVKFGDMCKRIMRSQERNKVQKSEELPFSAPQSIETQVLEYIYTDSDISPRKQLLGKLDTLNRVVGQINELLNLYPELDTKPYLKAVKGSKVKVYDNVSEAVDQGFKEDGINRCLNGINKTHLGFTWTIEHISVKEATEIRHSK